jgi:tetratricopeptide (TPR) repeat protein/DNA-binding MarR family transcriptional regulator
MASLTSDKRIVLHLHRNRKQFDAFEAPFTLSQDGIAEALGMLRNNVSRSLTQLLKEELLVERLAHVAGMKRRRKVYSLTPEGERVAAEALARLANETVTFKDADGTMREARVGAVVEGSRGLLDAFTAIEMVRAQGFAAVPSAGGRAETAAKLVHLMEEAPRTAGFVGRRKEMESLLGASGRGPDKGGMVIIQGIAGIGKSSLAARLCEALSPRYHMLWYRLHEWDGSRSLLVAIAGFLARIGRRRLQARLSKGTIDWGEAGAALREDLAPAPPVALALDDADRAWNRDTRALFALLLDLAPRTGMLVIVTTRTSLDFYDARQKLVSVNEIRLEGLEAEDAEALLAAGPAVEAGAAAAVPDGRLVHADAREIVEATKGHPLYLELLRDRGRGEAAKDMNRFLEAEVLARLAPQDLKIVQQLSVHRLPVASEAVVASDDEISRLRELVRLGLVVETETARFELHPLVREFVAPRLSREAKLEAHASGLRYWERELAEAEGDHGELALESLYHSIKGEAWTQAAEVAKEHADCLAKLGSSEPADLLGRMPQESLPESERAHVMLAIAYVLSSTRPEDAVMAFRDCMALARKHWSEQELAALEDETARALLRLERYEETIAQNRAALERYVKTRDKKGEARERLMLGRAYRRMGELAKAEEEYYSAVRILEGLGEKEGVAVAYQNLAIVQEAAGEVANSERSLRRAAESAGSRHALRAEAMRSLGDFLLRQGRREDGRRQLGEALREAAARSLAAEAAECELLLGKDAAAAGEWRDAEAKFRAAAQRVAAASERRFRGPSGEEAARLGEIGVEAHIGLAQATEALGRGPEAEAQWRAGARAALRAGDGESAAKCLLELGLMHEGAGKREEALKALDEGARVAESPRSRLAFRLALARITAAKGDRQRSRKEHEEALKLATAVADRFAEGRALEGLATLSRAEGKEEEAKGLLSKAEAAYSEAGRPLDAKRARDAARAPGTKGQQKRAGAG